MINTIKKYFIFWLKENKIDAVNRFQSLLNYFKNFNFIINFSILFGLVIGGIFIPVLYLIFSVLVFIFIIDLFLGRFTYLLKNSGLKSSAYSFLKSEIGEQISDEDIKNTYEKTNDLTEDYIDEINNKNNSKKSKFKIYLNKYFNIHEKIAKQIINFIIFSIFKKNIPNVNFNNYLLKLLFFPYLIIKKIIEFVLSFIVAIFKYIFNKIKSILIFIFLTIITFGLYLLYLFFYKHIRRIILFFKFIFLKIILFIKLIIKYFYIGIIIGLIYFSIKLGLIWLLIIEGLIVLFSVLLIIRSIVNDFIGISLFKATPQYLISSGIGIINPIASVFYLSVLAICENKEVGKIILEYIKGNYNKNFYNNDFTKEYINPENIWKIQIYDFWFNKKKLSIAEQKVLDIQNKINKTDKFINNIQGNGSKIGKVIIDEEKQIDDSNKKGDICENISNELSKKEIEELYKQEKELALLLKQKELERLKKKEEFNKKMKIYTTYIKKILKKSTNKIKRFTNKYMPILLVETKEIKTMALSSGNKIYKNILKKSKNIDKEGYKNIGLNSINEVKNFNIKYKKYIILILVFVFSSSVGKYYYDNFYYNNQIIKLGDSINFKKTPEFIEYFNNNKIKIIPNKFNSILSQTLMGYRYYTDENYYEFQTKKAGYEVMYTTQDDFGKNISKEEFKNKDIIFNLTKEGKNAILTYNEKINVINLYKTEIFSNINMFTNINTFYSTININGVSTNTKLGNIIFSNFEINDIINSIDDKNEFSSTNYRKIGLDYDNDFLILRLEYDFKKSVDLENNIINTSDLDYIGSKIKETSILLYEKGKIQKLNDSIFIEMKFRIDLEKLQKSNIFTKLY